MESWGRRRVAVWLWLVVAMVGLVACAECRSPVLHRVGGKRIGWLPNVNYTEWSIHEHFYVGDWLYFGFDRRYYNVLEVNKTNYENCIDGEFIKNITRGGRDVFNLTEEKPYYFLSSGGYCFHGMKLAVYVENIPPSPSPSAPLKNGSSSNSGLLITVLLVTALVLAFPFKTYKQLWIEI